MTSSKPMPRHRKPRSQARNDGAASRAVRAVMAFGYCPVWISGILLAYQALAELGATKRQAAK